MKDINEIEEIFLYFTTISTVIFKFETLDGLNNVIFINHTFINDYPVH